MTKINTGLTQKKKTNTLKKERKKLLYSLETFKIKFKIKPPPNHTHTLSDIMLL